MFSYMYVFFLGGVWGEIPILENSGRNGFCTKIGKKEEVGQQPHLRNEKKMEMLNSNILIAKKIY